MFCPPPAVTTPNRRLRLDIIGATASLADKNDAIQFMLQSFDALPEHPAHLVGKKTFGDFHAILGTRGHIVRVYGQDDPNPKGGFVIVADEPQIKNWLRIDTKKYTIPAALPLPSIGVTSYLPAPGQGIVGIRANADALDFLCSNFNLAIFGTILCQNIRTSAQIDPIALDIQWNPKASEHEFIFVKIPNFDKESALSSTQTPLSFKITSENLMDIQTALQTGAMGIVTRHGTHLSLIQNPIADAHPPLRQTA